MAAVVPALGRWSWELLRLCLGVARWTGALLGRQLYTLLRPFIAGTLASDACLEREALLAWVNRQLPGGAITNFGSDWRDGWALGALVNALAPADQRPPGNVTEAMERATQLLGVQPSLSVQEVMWAETETKLMAYITQLRASADRLHPHQGLLSTSSLPAADPAGGAAGACEVCGAGLSHAERGRPAEFVVRFHRAGDLDLLLELLSDAGDFFTQRVTARSPPRLEMEDSLRAPAGARLRRNIPLEYRVAGRSVTVRYRPPSEGHLEVTVVWRGHHVPGSPFSVHVAPGEPLELEPEDVTAEEASCEESSVDEEPGSWTEDELAESRRTMPEAEEMLADDVFSEPLVQESGQDVMPRPLATLREISVESEGFSLPANESKTDYPEMWQTDEKKSKFTDEGEEDEMKQNQHIDTYASNAQCKDLTRDKINSKDKYPCENEDAIDIMSQIYKKQDDVAQHSNMPSEREHSIFSENSEENQKEVLGCTEDNTGAQENSTKDALSHEVDEEDKWVEEFRRQTEHITAEDTQSMRLMTTNLFTNEDITLSADQHKDLGAELPDEGMSGSTAEARSRNTPMPPVPSPCIQDRVQDDRHCVYSVAAGSAISRRSAAGPVGLAETPSNPAISDPSTDCHAVLAEFIAGPTASYSGPNDRAAGGQAETARDNHFGHTGTVLAREASEERDSDEYKRFSRSNANHLPSNDNEHQRAITLEQLKNQIISTQNESVSSETKTWKDSLTPADHTSNGLTENDEILPDRRSSHEVSAQNAACSRDEKHSEISDPSKHEIVGYQSEPSEENGVINDRKDDAQDPMLDKQYDDRKYLAVNEFQGGAMTPCSPDRTYQSDTIRHVSGDRNNWRDIMAKAMPYVDVQCTGKDHIHQGSPSFTDFPAKKDADFDEDVMEQAERIIQRLKETLMRVENVSADKPRKPSSPDITVQHIRKEPNDAENQTQGTTKNTQMSGHLNKTFPSDDISSQSAYSGEESASPGSGTRIEWAAGWDDASSDRQHSHDGQVAAEPRSQGAARATASDRSWPSDDGTAPADPIGPDRPAGGTLCGDVTAGDVNQLHGPTEGPQAIRDGPAERDRGENCATWPDSLGHGGANERSSDVPAEISTHFNNHNLPECDGPNSGETPVSTGRVSENGEVFSSSGAHEANKPKATLASKTAGSGPDSAATWLGHSDVNTARLDNCADVCNQDTDSVPAHADTTFSESLASLSPTEAAAAVDPAACTGKMSDRPSLKASPADCQLRASAPIPIPAPRQKFSDQYSNFETPTDPKYRLHRNDSRTKVYLGIAMSRVRSWSTVQRRLLLPCMLEPAAESENSLLTVNNTLTTSTGADADEQLRKHEQDERDGSEGKTEQSIKESKQEEEIKPADDRGHLAAGHREMTGGENGNKRVMPIEVTSIVDKDKYRRNLENMSSDPSSSSDNDDAPHVPLPKCKPPERPPASEEIIEILDCLSPDSISDPFGSEHDFSVEPTKAFEDVQDVAELNSAITSAEKHLGFAPTNVPTEECHKNSQHANDNTSDESISTYELCDKLVLDSFSNDPGCLSSLDMNGNLKQSKSPIVTSEIKGDTSAVDQKSASLDSNSTPGITGIVGYNPHSHQAPLGLEVSNSFQMKKKERHNIPGEHLPRTCFNAEHCDEEKIPDATGGNDQAFPQSLKEIDDNEHTYRALPVLITDADSEQDGDKAREQGDKAREQSDPGDIHRTLSAGMFDTSETEPAIEPVVQLNPCQVRTKEQSSWAEGGMEDKEGRGKLVMNDTVYLVPGTPPHNRSPVLLRCVKRDLDQLDEGLIQVSGQAANDLKRSQDHAETMENGNATQFEFRLPSRPENILAEAEEDLAEEPPGNIDPVNDNEIKYNTEEIKHSRHDSPAHSTTSHKKESMENGLDDKTSTEHQHSANLVEKRPMSSCRQNGGRWLLAPSKSLDGYVTDLIRKQFQSGEEWANRTQGRLLRPTSCDVEEKKKMLERGEQENPPPFCRRPEITDKGRVVRLREMFEQWSRAARLRAEQRRASSRREPLAVSRSMGNLAAANPLGEVEVKLSEITERSKSSAELRDPEHFKSDVCGTRSARESSESETTGNGSDDQLGSPEAHGTPGLMPGQSRSSLALRRSVSSGAARPPPPGRSLSCWELSSLSTDSNRARFEAIQRYFEGLRDGRVGGGGGRAAVGPDRGPRPGPARSWLRRRSLGAGSLPGRFDLHLEGVRRSLRGLQRGASPPGGAEDGDSLEAAHQVVLAPADAPSSAPAPPQVMAEYPYLSKRRSRPRLMARGLIPHEELIRRGHDRVVAFGPGLFQGRVDTNNTFQLYVPDPESAPRYVTVYAARADAVTHCELRYLGFMYHEVAYRVGAPGWYRVHVTLAGRAHDVDFMVRATT